MLLKYKKAYVCECEYNTFNIVVFVFVFMTADYLLERHRPSVGELSIVGKCTDHVENFV